MAELSITRGLSELKLIAKRVEAVLQGMKLVDYRQKKSNTLLLSKKSMEDFERKVKADYQTVMDLVARFAKIKSAIIESNAKTMITIGGETMSVASAIERKKSIAFKRLLTAKMREDLTSAMSRMEHANTIIEAKLQEHLNTMFGSDKKMAAEGVAAISKQYREENEAVLVDPINASEMVGKLSDELLEFDSNVDFALSESNARTNINI